MTDAADNPEAAVLVYLAGHPGSTTSEIADQVFDPDDDNEMRNADSKVRYYLTEKYPHLIETAGTKPQRYQVDDDRVYAGIAEVTISTFDGDEVVLPIGAGVVWFNEGGDPNVGVVSSIEPDEGRS